MGYRMRTVSIIFLSGFLSSLLVACGGGGGSSTLEAEVQSVNQPAVAEECAPDCFLQTSDVNQDGDINVQDIIIIVNSILN